ncbi:MAG: hypothetical protein PHU68_12005, partial [Paludibacter sp.]|nr:hypothetical protein [Paludibacter sp.]
MRFAFPGYIPNAWLSLARSNKQAAARVIESPVLPEDETHKLIHTMMERYQTEERGIQIIELEEAYQMC